LIYIADVKGEEELEIPFDLFRSYGIYFRTVPCLEKFEKKIAAHKVNCASQKSDASNDRKLS